MGWYISPLRLFALYRLSQLERSATDQSPALIRAPNADKKRGIPTAPGGSLERWHIWIRFVKTDSTFQDKILNHHIVVKRD